MPPEHSTYATVWESNVNPKTFWSCYTRAMNANRLTALQMALADLPLTLTQTQGVDFNPATLVMRSGVSSTNDMEVAKFMHARTAELCGHFLLALDQAEHPEYLGFDLLCADGKVVFSHRTS